MKMLVPVLGVLDDQTGELCINSYNVFDTAKTRFHSKVGASLDSLGIKEVVD